MSINIPQLHKYLEILEITELTEIQKLCMEPLYNGESLFGLAPTGTGKTLAFILPLLLKIDTSKREHQTLILVPTRELGNQIANVANKVANAISLIDKKNILIRTAFGGTPVSSQIKEIVKKPQVIIATPGRILDLLEREILTFKNLNYLVLDEADIMTGMGFSDQVKEIANYLPMKFNVALFSATRNDAVSVLEDILLKNAKYISVNNETVNKVEQTSIYHGYILSSKENKFNTLVNLLQNEKLNEMQKGIIFCHTRETSHQLAALLKNEGFSIDALTGELGQVHRNSVIRNFKSGNLKFLVATNIAARGIDISDLSLVVHYDIPYSKEEYLHRSGRTGRAGKQGKSISLCDEKNLNYYSNMLTEIGLSSNKYIYENISTKLLSNQKRVLSKIVFTKFYINKGKNDKMRPGDIVGAFIKELLFEKEDIGNIFIFDNFTHIEINENKKEKVKNLCFKIKNLKVKIVEAR